MKNLTTSILFGAAFILAPLPAAWADAPTMTARLVARGASRVSGHAVRDGVALTLTLRSLPPGRYTVGLAERCPKARLPSDLRSGEVSVPRRRGDLQRALDLDWIPVGAVTSSDRRQHQYTVRLRKPPRDGLNTVIVREADSPTVSLSDEYGLVACGALRRPIVD